MKGHSKATIGKNIKELKADNMKKGKERGAGGKVRPMKQIIAIALSTAGVEKKEKKHEKMETKKQKKIEKKTGKPS